jgi:hypothetical protein
MLPQGRELINQYEQRYPATTEMIIKHLTDENYHRWTELPYYIVKFVHERIFNREDFFAPIEEEEMRSLFENYYE